MKKLLRFALMFILIFALVMLAESVILPALFGSATPGAAEPAATAAQSAPPPDAAPAPSPEAADELTVDEDGEYTEKDELALYIHLYGHLPGNFVTKAEAEAAGQVDRRRPLLQPRGTAAEGLRPRLDRVRRGGQTQDPRAGAHRVLQRRARLLHGRPLRQL